ncbi:ADP-ribosylation factor-like protein [Holdemanella biformis]|uniref:ADP-ribosylation factor-like protein n=1 Tax=Holdemanella biformis TaxID=1735 RepID=UPI002664E67A|nr:ADP-ribosylation factor-like protein [Holdemanella biformis]
MILSIVNEAILPLWLLWVLGGSLLVGLFCGLLSSPDENTKRIVVFGSKASGKTTLWNQLMDKKVVREEYRTTNQEKIESFNVFANNHYVKVLATKDIGGGDMFVRYYDELISENGTFVYFLVDLTRLHETKQEIRSRLQVISKCIKDKKLLNCGFKIIATHFDEYDKNNYNLLEKTKNAKAEVMSVLTDKKINNCSLKIDLDHIMVANLLDKSYINSIKKEIAQE